MLPARFVQAEEQASKTKEDLGLVSQEKEKVEEEVEAGEEEVKQIQTRIECLQQLRDGELGGRLEELETDLARREKASVTTGTDIKAVKDNAKQEERKKAQIIKGMNSVSFFKYKVRSFIPIGSGVLNRLRRKLVPVH